MALYWSILKKYNLSFASHMTHLGNLDGMLNEGGIYPYNRMKGSNYRDISMPSVQNGRANKTIPCTGRLLHEYVPLYFGWLTPMVACNQHINEDLIFLRVSLDILSIEGVVFTDGNAASEGTSFYMFHDLTSLNVLNVQAIQSVKYAREREFKRKKQAEILVPDFLEFSQVHDIFVFSELAKQSVMAKLSQNGIKRNVTVSPNWYFKDSIQS